MPNIGNTVNGYDSLKHDFNMISKYGQNLRSMFEKSA